MSDSLPPPPSADISALEQMYHSSQGSARMDLGLQLADRLISQADYSCAQTILSQIQPLAADPKNAALISLRLGRIHLRLSRYDQAYFYLGQALSQLADQPGSPELFMVYHDLAWMFYRQGQASKARSYLEGAELVLDMRSDREPGMEEARADLLHVSALIEAASGNHDLALTLLEDERQLRQRLGVPSRLSSVYNKIGGLYQAKGDMVKAQSFLNQALEIARDSGDRFREAVALKNLGEVFHSLGWLERSEECYQKSLDICAEVGNRLGLALAQAGLGRLHTSRRHFPQAEEHLLNALEVARQVKSLEREASIMADLAELYCLWGRLDLASRQLEAAEEINDQRDQFLSARHQIVVAKVLSRSGRAQNLSQARVILEGLVTHPIMIDDEESYSAVELEIEANLLLSQVLAKLGFRGRAQTLAAKAQALVATFSGHFDADTKERFFARPEIAGVFAWQRELGA